MSCITSAGDVPATPSLNSTTLSVCRAAAAFFRLRKQTRRELPHTFEAVHDRFPLACNALPGEELRLGLALRRLDHHNLLGLGLLRCGRPEPALALDGVHRVQDLGVRLEVRHQRVHHLVLADEHLELRAFGFADEDDPRRQHRVG